MIIKAFQTLLSLFFKAISLFLKQFYVFVSKVNKLFSEVVGHVYADYDKTKKLSSHRLKNNKEIL